MNVESICYPGGSWTSQRRILSPFFFFKAGKRAKEEPKKEPKKAAKRRHYGSEQPVGGTLDHPLSHELESERVSK